MVKAFDVTDVNPNPARFDLKKADAINGDHIRLLKEDDFAARMVPYLQAGGVLGATPTAAELEILAQAAPLVQTRMNVLSEAPGLLAFLFTPTAELDFAEDARASLPANSAEVLAAGAEALDALAESDWATETIQAVLQSALIDTLELKPRIAFGPLRVGISGQRISPPLFESMEILGKADTLARLAKLAATL
jgi:glutamyl-tRNA synthetase